MFLVLARWRQAAWAGRGLRAAQAALRAPGTSRAGMTVTKAERTLDAALAALAERPGGMLIREMEEALPGELHRHLREAVQIGRAHV